MSKGGRGPKRKAYAHEHRLVTEAQGFGLDAARAWGSNGRASGWHEHVDVVIDGWKIQCKARKSVARDLLPSEHVDAVALHVDRCGDVVMLRLADFLGLLTRGN